MEALSQRDHLYGLYNDPNWLLQAGMADIEFEQDMYDDFMYGKPALPGMGAPQEYMDLLSSFPDDPYDKLAMEGLRKHAKEGIYRYLDRTPYDVGPLEYFGKNEDENFATYKEWERNPGADPRTKRPPNWMDFNLPKIINHWNKYTYDNKQGNLQDQISDYARHEYKHALYPDKPGDYSHPAIFGSGVRYNLDPVTTGSSMSRFQSPKEFEPSQYNPHLGGQMAQETVQKYARPPRGVAGFSTGGIVTLVL